MPLHNATTALVKQGEYVVRYQATIALNHLVSQQGDQINDGHDSWKFQHPSNLSPGWFAGGTVGSGAPAHMGNMQPAVCEATGYAADT